ncbi:MAG: thiamine-phosphate kinase [Actinomycetota bacterium]
MELSERDLVRGIRKVLSGKAPGVVVAVGDDAAVVEPGRHQGVLTADMLVEGVHFELGATSAHDLGYKAISVNVSDVAAMGGSPRYGLACLGLSEGIEAAWVMELYGGMREAADEYGMAIVGGDTSRADRAVVSVTLSGEVAEGRAVTRSGARAGDVLVVTGSLGGSAGGLRIARDAGRHRTDALSTEWGRSLLAIHERPRARVGEGQALGAAGARAMIDLSDGLAIDLGRLCEESGVGARVRLPDLPITPGLVDLSAATDADPLDLALHGGEDYELLAALPPDAVEEARRTIVERFGTRLTEIGEVVEGSGLVALRGELEEPLEPKGWDHFVRR